MNGVNGEAHRARLVQAGQLLASVVHEINNPLAVIQGYTQLLYERCEDTVQREDLDRILSETRRLGQLVEDMLSFTRRNDGDTSSSDLCDAVTSAVNLTRHDMRQHDISVVAPLPRERILVRGSKGALIQVLLNLLFNARDSLAEAPTLGRSVTIEVEPHDGHVDLVVSNNGPEIPEDLADAIFAPFFTTKPDGAGTGLGLSLCRDVLAPYDGRIELDRDRTEGVAFRVTLATPDA